MYDSEVGRSLLISSKHDCGKSCENVCNQKFTNDRKRYSSNRCKHNYGSAHKTE